MKISSKINVKWGKKTSWRKIQTVTQLIFFNFFKSSPEHVYWFLEREEGRERERTIDQLPLAPTPTRDRTRNLLVYGATLTRTERTIYVFKKLCNYSNYIFLHIQIYVHKCIGKTERSIKFITVYIKVENFMVGFWYGVKYFSLYCLYFYKNEFTYIIENLNKQIH